MRLDILLSLPEFHHIRCLNLFIPIINAIKARKNVLSILYKIKIQNPRRHVIIYFTTESTKAAYIQRVDGIRLTLNIALFICLLLFAIPKAIRRWAVLGSNIPS